MESFAFANIPGVWTMSQLRFKDGCGHLWSEDGNRRLRAGLEGWDWLEREKLRVVPMGGDSREII